MATIKGGNAVSTIRQVTTIVQLKVGSRSIDIPGARRRTIVTKMQAAIRNAPQAASSTPMIQKSSPLPGVLTRSDRGSYAYQPADAAPFTVNQPDHIIKP